MNKEILQNYNTRLNENNTSLTEVLNMINELPEAGTGEMIDMYSTEETKTNKVWIDGKPIYRKVGTIIFSAIWSGDGPYTKGDYISGDIEQVTINEIFNEGIGSGATFYTGSNLATEIYVDNGANSANKGYIMGFTKNNGFLNSLYYVVVEYTKTTD